MAVPARTTSQAEAEVIVDSYLARAEGNAVVALRLVVQDALADLCEVERQVGERDRLISHGYVRAGLPPAGRG